MLSVRNLSKSYPPKADLAISGCGNSLLEKNSIGNAGNKELAVDNISFSLKKNEILGILGENGSGKSTLLKLIAGLSEPDSGTIMLNHSIITGPKSKLVAGHNHIKLIHQNYNLFPNISLAENILYAMRFYTHEYQNRKLEELLDLCNLNEISHKLPRETSGGEQQRTAIAAALATDIELLLLDEPFSNLDIFSKSQLKEHIRKITRRLNISVVFVTHDAQDALSTATQMAIIRKGKVLQMDVPQNIYRLPSNMYVATITGDVNVLDTNMLNRFYTPRLHFLPGKKYALRPEDISITDAEQGIRASVKSRIFMGNHDIIIAEIKKGFSVKIYASKSKVQPNDTIYLQFDKDRIFTMGA